MARENKKDTAGAADAANAGASESKYPKGQIIASATFANRRDLLSVLLEDGKEYTIAEVKGIMDSWFKKGVK